LGPISTSVELHVKVLGSASTPEDVVVPAELVVLDGLDELDVVEDRVVVNKVDELVDDAVVLEGTVEEVLLDVVILMLELVVLAIIDVVLTTPELEVFIVVVFTALAVATQEHAELILLGVAVYP